MIEVLLIAVLLLVFTEKDIQPQLSRRRPGQSKMTTDRQEKDQVTILSGTENGMLATRVLSYMWNIFNSARPLLHRRDPRHANWAVRAQ